MLIFNCISALLFVFGELCSAASLEYDVSSQQHAKRETGAIEARMVAASRISKLKKRADHLGLYNSFDLEYIEETHHGSADIIATTIHVESSKSVLLLEDHEHLMHRIECSQDKISLSFSGYSDLSTDFLDELEGGFLISSHAGCNDQGVRSVFSVEGYELLQEGIVASLSVHRVAWKAAFPNMTIKMGQVESKLDYQPREELLRRQDTPTPTSSTSAATTTATDLSLATQIVNKDLDFEFVDAGCTNCTTTGSLGFDATFDLDDYSGEATIVLNGFSAYMALHVNVPDSNKYEIPLPFERNVTVNAPDTVQLTLDLDQPSNSNQTGFDDWQSTALPFSAEVEVHDVNITLGLRNSFMVEWRDSDDGDDDKTQNRTASDPDAYAGLYLDLPVLSTKITALESVDADCNPLDNTNLDATNKSSILKALNKPYSIEPFAKMEFGVKGLEIVDDIDGPLFPPKELPLPKTCLNFDSDSKSYLPAAEVVKNIEGTSDAMHGMINPLARPLASTLLVLSIFAALA
ncbi:GPI anchored protein [Lasiodiplodia theobromae]|uniref:GPI anchored protein n=1 Tax=Lasiodiplodia theobromae TaxID=45133 RepID=UPI0015C3A57D|nr:GPI anchored protein [Lasiodiplodia theobromae]KAF4541869.1 GPI anchored protein [Lasiodiplodia theobromae]